jgi:hypothetical protein
VTDTGNFDGRLSTVMGGVIKLWNERTLGWKRIETKPNARTISLFVMLIFFQKEVMRSTIAGSQY